MFSVITNVNTWIFSWAARSRPGSWYVASSATRSLTRCFGASKTPLEAAFRNSRKYDIRETSWSGNSTTMDNGRKWPMWTDVEMIVDDSPVQHDHFQGYFSSLEGKSLHRSPKIAAPNVFSYFLLFNKSNVETIFWYFVRPFTPVLCLENNIPSRFQRRFHHFQLLHPPWLQSSPPLQLGASQDSRGKEAAGLHLKGLHIFEGLWVTARPSFLGDLWGSFLIVWWLASSCDLKNSHRGRHLLRTCWVGLATCAEGPRLAKSDVTCWKWFSFLNPHARLPPTKVKHFGTPQTIKSQKLRQLWPCMFPFQTSKQIFKANK